MSNFKTDGLRVEIVDWIDSNMRTRWDNKEIYLESSHDSMACRSVGWVVREDQDRVCLLQSESDTCFAEMITIPKVAITKRTRLRI